jgi:hypothetical protein
MAPVAFCHPYMFVVARLLAVDDQVRECVFVSPLAVIILFKFESKFLQCADAKAKAPTSEYMESFIFV